MHPFSRSFSALLFCLCSCLLAAGACAADASYTGYLGDVIGLHGYSYAGGEEVYLFMTGPGLPSDGVTLTDVSQRADQGQFTVVPLDSSQQWSMKWDTSRIWNEIDPGTYTVYVTTEPVDYSHLGGSSTYQTLSVYLKDPGTRTGGSSSTSYTLNLEDQVSTQETVSLPSAAAPVITTPVPPSGTLQHPATPTLPVSTGVSARTTTKAAMHPLIAVIALTCMVCFLISRTKRK